MSMILTVAVPVFAIILLGWAAGRIGVLGAAASDALNRFVYWFAIPPLLFMAMARTPIADIIRPNFIAAYLIGTYVVALLAAGIGQLVHRETFRGSVVQGLNASFANTGYMGIPLFAAAFGDPGIAAASLATVCISAAVIGVGVVALELADADTGHGPLRRVGKAMSAFVTNPLVVAPVAGVAVSVLDIPVPAPLARFLDLIGAAASPCALFAIGLFLATRRFVADPWEIGWMTVLKLLWHPLITWLLIRWFFPMEPFWEFAAVLLAALPTGTLTFVLAQRYGVAVDRCSAVILVSTVCSMATLTVLLAMLTPMMVP